MRSRHRTRRSLLAFTLLELLIVLGVVALVIAILLPVIARAREAANQVKCMSNLRQLAAAFIMYANNNRGIFPGAAPGIDNIVRRARPDDWIYWEPGRDVNQSAIAVYLGARGDALSSVLRCPSDDPLHRPDPPSQPGETTAWVYPYAYSYAMNLYLDGDPHEEGYVFPRPLSYYQVRHPAEKILLAEPDARLFNSGMWYPGTVDLIARVHVWRTTV